MKNPFIESLRKALGEVINWDAVADKPTGDIDYMNKQLNKNGTQKTFKQRDRQSNR